jgi:hypothetical protein
MQIQDVSPDWWGIILTRRQWHDDAVYLQRIRHPIALGYSQWCMRITLIMMLYHRQSLQTRFLLSYSEGWGDGGRHQILFGLLVSPSPLKYGESTSWVSCLGHQEDLDSYLSQSTHSPSGWKLCQWWISHKKQWSSSYKASYIGSAYPDGFWQITGLSSKEQSLWDATLTMVSTISRHQQRILRRMGRLNEWTCLFYKG